jgi:hypothetical protein
MSETQDLTINYDFIKNVSSSTDINEAASILQRGKVFLKIPHPPSPIICQ